ncbi:hypothetical protein RvY_13713 [Ramazzottius varieornatus]|uniref:SAM domain-containing protein n=1 Tax=Ramazzottius varieornatus TaxID=947166 RepID=A0A1D1VNV8_RAMVA|nr:hypothetical protein RvY_13713 [Ramazzottius varieornatus]
MGNQSSNINNEHASFPDNHTALHTSLSTSGSNGDHQTVMLPMTTSPLSLSSSPFAGNVPAAQQKSPYTALSISPKELSAKKKSTHSASGKSNKEALQARCSTSSEAGGDHAPSAANSSPDMEPQTARGISTRSSCILRGSFRRVKVLNNVPPPVVPDEKFNRLSNVSLGSSSGFGSSGSSQESTASSDSASSTLSSYGNGSVVHPPYSTLTYPLLLPAAEVSSSTHGPAAHKARMNLRLNIAPNNPPVNGTSALNGIYGGHPSNPFGSTGNTFNHLHSPLQSPLPSPQCNAGSTAVLRSPKPNGDLTGTAAFFRNYNRNTADFHNSRGSPADHCHVMTSQTSDNLKSPTRSDYVELMCSSDSRHSRSSFSSFDGSNYSTSSFNNSPNAAPNLDITSMFQSGMNDNEVLSAWLGSIGFTEYFPNFVQAAYDMPTIARMTTEDLTAIGLTKPNHRKRIRAEIAKLANVDLNFGCDLPDTAAQFLHAVGMSEYLPVFTNQNYNSIDKILNMTWDDLEDIGVRKLGHLKKLTLAIKHFRALRRQTAQSLAMEDHMKRFSTGSQLSQHDSQLGNNLADDDKSSASRSSLNSPRRLLESHKTQAPVLTTFQSLTSSVKDPTSEPALWRPRSALGRYPSPLALTPDSEEIFLCSDKDEHSPSSEEPSENMVNGGLSNGHCTLPRRKSLKSPGKSFSKMVAHVFRTDRSEKGSSGPSSPVKDRMDSVDSVISPTRGERLVNSPTVMTAAPLASFVNSSKLLPPAHRLPPAEPSTRSRTSPNTLDFNELGSLSRFPPPPSPLLRPSLSSSTTDMDKTPTLPHRTFACVEQHQQPINNSRTIQQASSMPFAQDNIGTIKQRAGRSIPPINSLVFRDGGNPPRDQVSSLDEITGMLASLTDELDEAMCQLENAAH